MFRYCLLPARSRASAFVLAALLLSVDPLSDGPSPVAAQSSKPSEQCEDFRLAAKQRIAACSRVIADRRQSDEDRAEALTTRGSLFDDEGRHDEALADFTAALKLVPNDPTTWIARGNAWDNKGEKQKAIADYTEAIRLNPGDAAPYYNRGTVHQELGETAKAAADYRKALEIDPEFDQAKQALAELASK